MFRRKTLVSINFSFLEKEMVTHSSILPGKMYGQRSLVGYSLWCQRESDTTKPLNNSRNRNMHWIRGQEASALVPALPLTFLFSVKL